MSTDDHAAHLARAGRTAISRSKASAPTSRMHSYGWLSGRVLDYGCGKGKDVRWLSEQGYDVVGYDPVYAPDVEMTGDYDTVICNYVLNVLPLEMQLDLLEAIKAQLVPGGTAYITVRGDVEEHGTLGRLVGEGTERETFQRDVKLWLPVIYNKHGKFRIYKLEKPHVE
jgi:2-polyprenyl-3-methyl-5-hydroxy-6-metoxy-1,4-benzoquinol methylase